MPLVDGKAQGVLEMHAKGFGFLRDPARHYSAQPADPYVSAQLISKLGLAEGVLLAGTVEPSKGKGSGPRIAHIDAIEGEDPARCHKTAISIS